MAANVGEVVATSLRNRSNDLVDNVTNNNALLERLEKKGNIRKVTDGGRTIFESFIHGTNSSAQWFSDYDTFTPPISSDVIDGAEYNWKQLGGFASFSRLEKIKNMGKGRAIDWAKARVKQLKANLRNLFAAGLFADGTGNAGKEFGGLQHLVADDPTAAGTVGGINQVTQSFWRNYYSAAAATTSASITGRMNAAHLGTVRGKDAIDLWLAGTAMFRYYWESLQSIQRIGSPAEADAGYMSLKYLNSDVVYDENCASTRMYGLMTDYLNFRYAPDNWFSVDDPRQVVNGAYEVVPVWVAGNLTCSYRQGQAVIIAT